MIKSQDLTNRIIPVNPVNHFHNPSLIKISNPEKNDNTEINQVCLRAIVTLNKFYKIKVQFKILKRIIQTHNYINLFCKHTQVKAAR